MHNRAHITEEMAKGRNVMVISSILKFAQERGWIRVFVKPEGVRNLPESGRNNTSELPTRDVTTL
jgi:hypothetical protein